MPTNLLDLVVKFDNLVPRLGKTCIMSALGLNPPAGSSTAERRSISPSKDDRPTKAFDLRVSTLFLLTRCTC